MIFSMRAFSLVELSIVLVILGLLTGGILAGQSLIKAAQLRAITTEHEKYKAAIYAFRDKYFALPGDMTNATRFWGAADNADGLGTDCRDADTGDARTCNGNGDGIMGDHPSAESSRGWQQLASAGLINGRYVGTSFASVTSCNGLGPNCTFPGSRFSANSIWQYYRHDFASGAIYEPYWNANLLQLTGGGTTAVNFLLQYILTPEEMWNIDTKSDDGRPGRGKLSAYRPGVCDTSATNDNSAAAAATAQYQLAIRTLSCVPIFTDVP